MTRLILASASSSRARLLREAGLTFSVVPAHVDEAAFKEAAKAEGLGALDVAMALAELKAGRISARHPEALVIGADQMLVAGGRWYDKPRDLAEARTQLLALSGAQEELPTAVVVAKEGAVIWRHLSRPRIRLRSFTPELIEAYLAAEREEEVVGAVGAIRIEGPGIQLIAAIEGDYFAILGLPLLPLLAFLRDHLQTAWISGKA